VHDDASQGYAVRVCHRLTDYGIGLRRDIVSGQKNIGHIPEQAVDGIGVNETLDVECVGGLELHCVELFVVNDDVAIFFDLIAPYQIAAIHRTRLRIGRNHADAIVRLGVEKIKRDVVCA
jgi:hypothetical protein